MEAGKSKFTRSFKERGILEITNRRPAPSYMQGGHSIRIGNDAEGIKLTDEAFDYYRKHRDELGALAKGE